MTAAIRKSWIPANELGSQLLGPAPSSTVNELEPRGSSAQLGANELVSGYPAPGTTRR